MAGRGRLYDELDLTGRQGLFNGKPLPEGVTVQDWMRLHESPGFYSWLNSIRGCGDGMTRWRLDLNHWWCGV